MEKSIVGYNLKRWRVRFNMTQELVSELTGISVRTISRIECGEAGSERTLRELCALYHINYNDLYKDEEAFKPVGLNVLSVVDAACVLAQNDFLTELQRAIIIRFTGLIGENALMDKKQVEKMINNIISDKKQYTKAELIQCCLEASMCTVQNINAIAIAS